MDRHPADGPNNRQHGGKRERGRPAIALRDPRSERGGNGTADLTSHVHHAREHARTAARNIHGDRPEGTLRQVQCTGPCGQNDSGEPRIMNLRAQHEAYRCKNQCHSGQAATANPQSILPCQSIAQCSPTRQHTVIDRKGNIANWALDFRSKPRTCAMYKKNQLKKIQATYPKLK